MKLVHQTKQVRFKITYLHIKTGCLINYGHRYTLYRSIKFIRYK